MAKRKNEAKGTAKQPPKKSNLPLILTTAFIVCAAVVVVAGGGLFGENQEGSTTTQIISAGEFLSIPTEEITSTAAFFPIQVDGTDMEVFAIRASDGTVRTAFNTCQSCFLSGRGYYLQDGDDLVCQNCGFHFTPDQVEIQSGGCNPWPIFADYKTVTEDTIQISYEFLKSATVIFENWKQ